MNKKFHLKCVVCNQSGIFEDEVDIRQSRWRIIAWDVKTADPKCVCNTCEYGTKKKD